MRATLFGTPLADVRAQLADLLGKRAIAGDRIGAQSADCRALDTAGRTGVFAFLADHMRETVAALGGTVIAGGNAVFGVLVQMMTHGVIPFVEIERYWRARNARTVKEWSPVRSTFVKLPSPF